MRYRVGQDLASVKHQTSSIQKTQKKTYYTLLCTNEVKLITYKFDAVCAANRLLYRAFRLRLSSQASNDAVSLENGFWPTFVMHGMIKSVLPVRSFKLKSVTKFSAHVISCSLPTFTTNLPCSPALRRRSISENCQCRYCFRMCFLHGPLTVISYPRS